MPAAVSVTRGPAGAGTASPAALVPLGGGQSRASGGLDGSAGGALNGPTPDLVAPPKNPVLTSTRITTTPAASAPPAATANHSTVRLLFGAAAGALVSNSSSSSGGDPAEATLTWLGAGTTAASPADERAHGEP